MEGPTPVSALIHAATLVTAGVFLIIRCSIIFEASNSTLSLLTLLGSVTCFFAGSVGLVQNDLKRIIAYSTCSQLGYMVFICGLSHYSVGLFHLANHAVFKALLFLSAGSVIHGLVDEQDIRKFGGIIRLFPVSYVMFLIGSLALTGFPFLTGFYSKDVILEVASAKHTLYGNFSHTLGCLAACFTSFYSFRLVILTFINRTNGYKVSIQNAHEGSIRLLFPLMVLGVGSIVIGFLTKDLMIGLGSTAFQNSIFVLPMNHVLIDSEFLNPIIKNLPLVFTIIGAICSWFLLYSNTVLSKGVILQYKLTALNKKLFMFLSKK
jgi:NADH-ubiquinone oxidoreductase chain 5